MPQAANIVINDGENTPISHTFEPTGKDAKEVLIYEQITPLPLSFLETPRVGYKHVRNTAPQTQLRSTQKITFTLRLPIAETLGTADSGLTPPPTLAWTDSVRIEFDVSDRGVKQSRENLRVLAINLLSSAMAVSAVDDLRPTYA